jgi:hypothetical protein
MQWVDQQDSKEEDLKRQIDAEEHEEGLEEDSDRRGNGTWSKQAHRDTSRQRRGRAKPSISN